MAVETKNVCRWGQDTSEWHRTIHINGTDYTLERTKEGYLLRSPPSTGDDGLPTPAITRRLPLDLQGDGFFTRAVRAAVAKRPYTDPLPLVSPAVSEMITDALANSAGCQVCGKRPTFADGVCQEHHSSSRKPTPPTPSTEVEKGTEVATEQGVAIRTIGNGQTAAEQRINQLEKVCDSLHGQISMLIYDIPSTLNDVCPNPSHILWWYGFRLNKSCWVLTERGLKAKRVQQLLEHWSGHAVEVHIIPYHESALAQIRGIAREKLAEEVRRVHTSLIQRISNADERLTTAITQLEEEAKEQETQVSTADEERARIARMNQVRNIIRGAAEALDASISCAKLFDETESIRDLLQGLREAILAESRSFNASALVRQHGLKPAPTKVPMIS